jgi:hypothetical protein
MGWLARVRLSGVFEAPIDMACISSGKFPLIRIFFL